jgi:hypothetical protein
MPATRLTIALNANRSQQAPLLVPASALADPVVAGSIRAHVFKTAQSKLRLKKPSRIFVGKTGYELVNEEDWKDNIEDDAVLLVSAGEDFVGVKRESVTNGEYHLTSNFNMSIFALILLAESRLLTTL